MSSSTTQAPFSPSEQLADKNILLSGTTGFLGKVVLSMLLCRFPKIGKIYTLIRPGISEKAVDRFNKSVLTSPALKPVFELYGEQTERIIAEKVIPVDGNVTQENCGLSAASLELLEKNGLDIFINSAGLVDFDPPVDQALSINAHGAQHSVALARRLNAALVHVSTCFVAGQRSGQILEDEAIVNQLPQGEHEGAAEEFDFATEIQKLGELAQEVRNRADDPAQKARWRRDAEQKMREEGRDPDDANALKAAILRQKKIWQTLELKRVGMERSKFWGWTNTYTFTKSLGEQVIAQAVNEGLNAAIVRPAIVESALNFPFPGWNEGFTTTAPLIMMILNGVPHFPTAEDLVLDVIPCDMVASVIIAAAAACLSGPHKLVYQAASGDTNPLRINRALMITGLEARQRAKKQKRKGWSDWWKRHNETRPLSRTTFEQLSLPRYRQIASLVLRSVDTLGPDKFGWIRQPAGFLRDIATEVEKEGQKLGIILDLFMPFVTENKYIFRTDNTRFLMSRIVEKDKNLLQFDPTSYDWRSYWLDVHVKGLEKWVMPQLKEEMAEKPKTAYMYRDLVELFETASHRHRHRIAFHFQRNDNVEYLTYGELRKLAHRVAAFLGAHGIKKDDRVLLISENRPEWAAAYFGILLAGGTVVPMDQNAMPLEVQNVFRSAEAKGIVASPRVYRRLQNTKESTITNDIDAFWQLDTAVCYPQELSQPQSPAQVASLIFTSGTTGTPKGVMLSQRNFTFEVSRLAGIFNLAENDHLLSVLPLHHTFEFTAGLLMPLSQGSRVTYLEVLDGDSLQQALKNGVTGLIGVPALWQLLQRRIESQASDSGALSELILTGIQEVNAFLRERFDLNIGLVAAYPVHRALGGRLKFLVSGGSALNQDTLKFFRSLGFNLTEGYGLTETSPVLTVTSLKEKMIPGSVGKPIPGVEIQIHEPDNDGIGEVWAKGPNVMLGYFGNDKATSEVMQNGWFRTGDLGRVDEEGRLYIVGRQKDVIIDADGRNVYPDELEEAYGNHPQIKELSVVGLPQSGGTERVACLIVPNYDSTSGQTRDATRVDISAHFKSVSDRLPYYKRIKVMHFWDGDLPRTAKRSVKRLEVVQILQRLVQRTHDIHEVGIIDDEQSPVMVARRAVALVTGKKVTDISAESRLAADLGFDSLMYVELASVLENHARADLSSDALMSIERVQDLSRLLRTTDVSTSTHPAAKNTDDKTTDEATVIPIPKPAAKFGKKLLSFGQRKFYERVMDVDVRGYHYVPRDQGFLVAANHTSHLDAGLVKIALGDYGRNLAALAARDYFFKSKLRRTYFENFTNLVPIERHGALKQSLRRALAILESGQSLLIFPEGTRSENGVMTEFKPSVGYLALSSKRPVVPMYLWGTHEAMPKGSMLVPNNRRIGASIGPAISYEHLHTLLESRPKNEAYRLATHVVELAVRKLRAGENYRSEQLVAEVLQNRPASTMDEPAALSPGPEHSEAISKKNGDNAKVEKHKPRSRSKRNKGLHENIKQND